MRDHKRRTVLKTVGSVGVVGGLAGCLGNGGDGGEEPENGNGDGGEESDSEGESGSGEGTDSEEETEQEEETESEEQPEADAALRVAHLSPDAPNVDVYVDGDTVLEDVPFRAVSEYLELPSGEYDVMITAAGDMDTVVFDQPLEVPEGEFTAAAIGELADENEPFALEVYTDDTSNPEGMARVRLIHASPDAPNVDVTAGGDVLLEDVPFGAAGAIEVPAGEYELEVRPATENNDGDVVATFELAPEAGVVYTAAAVGYLEPGAAPADVPFDLEVVEDARPGGD
jgi:hypothetical protein